MITQRNKENHMRYDWYQIDVQLPANTNHLEARLIYIDVEGKTHTLPLAISFKGRLFEVVRLKRHSHTLQLEVRQAEQLIAVNGIRCDRISVLRAYYWMGHRVIAMLPKLSLQLRRRMGLRNRLLRSFYEGYRLVSSFRYHYPPPAYEDWCQRYWLLQPHHKKNIARFRQGIKSIPNVIVLIDARGATDFDIKQSVSSVQNQEGFNYKPCVWTDLQQIIKRLDKLEGENTAYVLYVQAGCTLQPGAIAWWLWEQIQQPQWLCIYSDHDHYNALQRCQPIFKPQWSQSLQRSTAYVGDVLWLNEAVFIEAVQLLGNQISAYSLMLEIGLKYEQKIGHIPATLWSKPISKAIGSINATQIDQLNLHLKRHRIYAKLNYDKFGLIRVRYSLPERLPMVSIIIPTRDMLHLLQPCIESILSRTQWPMYEIIVVDNQSTCNKTIDYLQQIISLDSRCRLLTYDAPFNYSAINNFAVKQARGEIICLLNNDTEVITYDWLHEMVSQLLQPQVGAVGARLYYTDGRVQHAGDVVGVGGCATHLHGVLEPNDAGYMYRAVATQELSAVTAACLLTYKELYEELGGLNQINLTVAFNDVDYCLRVGAAGYKVIYTPYAELYHHESVSRGQEDTPQKKARAKEEADFMRSTWKVVREGDPFYNPNLNHVKADFTLSKVPLLDWPWSGE